MKTYDDVRSKTKPEPLVRGPSATICNTGIHACSETDPVTGEAWSGWEYSSVHFAPGEYEDMLGGSIRDGAQWTDQLRAIQRNRLLRRATDMIVRHQTYDPDTDKLAEWTAYARGVLATTQQPGYPQEVGYPTAPDERRTVTLTATFADLEGVTHFDWRVGDGKWVTEDPSATVTKTFDEGRDVSVAIQSDDPSRTLTITATGGCEVSGTAIGQGEEGAVVIRPTSLTVTLTVH